MEAEQIESIKDSLIILAQWHTEEEVIHSEVDKALSAIISIIDTPQPSSDARVEEVTNLIAKELPMNYDGTNPGNYHILESIGKHIHHSFIEWRDTKIRFQEDVIKKLDIKQLSYLIKDGQQKDKEIGELKKYQQMVDVGGSEREFNKKVCEGYKAKIKELERDIDLKAEIIGDLSDIRNELWIEIAKLKEENQRLKDSQGITCNGYHYDVMRNVFVNQMGDTIKP